MRRRTVAAGSLALVALSLAGCGGGDNPGGSTSLRAGMHAVKDGPESQAFFAWADLRALRKLIGASSASAAKKGGNPKWARMVTGALPQAAGIEPQLSAATGIDAYRGDRAVTIGKPPNRAGRVDNVATATIVSRVRGLGARQETAAGRSFLSLAAENSVDISNPKLANGVYLILNRVSVRGATVAFGLSDRPIDEVLGGGRSLGDVPAESAMAGCLGDDVVAQITAPPPGSDSSVTLLGIGVLRPQPGDVRVREVLCEVTSKGAADTLAATIKSRVQPDAPLPVAGYHVRDQVADAAVDQPTEAGVPLVRLTVDLVGPARAGFLFFDVGQQAGEARSGLAFLAGGSGLPRRD